MLGHRLESSVNVVRDTCLDLLHVPSMGVH
jgi:hypothetical protein